MEAIENMARPGGLELPTFWFVVSQPKMNACPGPSDGARNFTLTVRSGRTEPERLWSTGLIHITEVPSLKHSGFVRGGGDERDGPSNSQ